MWLIVTQIGSEEDVNTVCSRGSSVEERSSRLALVLLLLLLLDPLSSFENEDKGVIVADDVDAHIAARKTESVE